MKSLYLAGVLALAAGSVNAAIVEYEFTYLVDEVTREFIGHGDDENGVRYQLKYSRTDRLETPSMMGFTFKVDTEKLDWPTDKLEWKNIAPEWLDFFVYGSTNGSVTLGADGIPTDWTIEEGWRSAYEYYTPQTASYKGWHVTGLDYLGDYGFGAVVPPNLDGFGYVYTIYESDQPLEWTVTGLPQTETPAPVPLPAAGFLLIGALAGLGMMTRRNKAV